MNLILKFFHTFFFISLISYTASVNAEPAALTLSDLSVEPSFLEADVARRQIYVSLPDANRVTILSLDTLEEVGSIDFVGKPQGLDLSDDGQRLYVALSETGTVATVDLNSTDFVYDEVSVSEEMIVPNGTIPVTDLYQVREINGSQVFVTANTVRANNQRFFIVFIDRADANSVKRVGLVPSGNFTSFNGQALIDSTSPSAEYLYVENNGLITTLDIRQPDGPRANRGNASQGGGLAKTFQLSNDGTRLYTKAGQILDAENILNTGRFDQIALTAQGASVLNLDETSLFVLDPIAGGGLSTLKFSANNGTPEGTLSDTCGFTSWLSQTVTRSPNDQGLLILGNFDVFEPNYALCYLPDDIDGDGLDNFIDNCPRMENSDQVNTDSDQEGNVCDEDDDNDGVLDASDAFPLFFGAAFDTDRDGMPNTFVNCDQNCRDVSGLVEDLDDDNDGVLDTFDRFPTNSAFSEDNDFDFRPDSFTPSCDQECQSFFIQIGFVLDNCPNTPNFFQEDSDNDGIGDACESDDLCFPIVTASEKAVTICL